MKRLFNISMMVAAVATILVLSSRNAQANVGTQQRSSIVNTAGAVASAKATCPYRAALDLFANTVAKDKDGTYRNSTGKKAL